jgi:hypothetical protein
MSKLLIETKVKNGRKIKLFQAKDRRHYIQRISFLVGEDEDTYFEWLNNEDYEMVWKPALATLW